VTAPVTDPPVDERCAAGQQVVEILNHKLTTGDYHFAVNANKLSSGVYFIRTCIGDGIHSQKIVLMK
jgi:hypothetical protein